MMRLRIFLPSECFLEKEVYKVKGEGLNGCFCLKPRHVDYVTALVPGIFSYEDGAGIESFLAVDSGTLVKQEAELMIATRRAVVGDLGRLYSEVEKMRSALVEEERQHRSTAAQLEAGFLRRLMEFGHGGR